LSGIIFGAKNHLYSQEYLVRDALALKKLSSKASKSI